MPEQDSSDLADGPRILALALGWAAPAKAPGDPMDEAMRAHLDAWRERTGAPESELRRAARRLAEAVESLPPGRAAALLSGPPRPAAAALVSELGRFERDFEWDVPLRDVARAMLEAAARALRQPPAGDDHAPGDISQTGEGRPGAIG